VPHFAAPPAKPLATLGKATSGEQSTKCKVKGSNTFELFIIILIFDI
jgi:hypothetical protein